MVSFYRDLHSSLRIIRPSFPPRAISGCLYGELLQGRRSNPFRVHLPCLFGLMECGCLHQMYGEPLQGLIPVASHHRYEESVVLPYGRVAGHERSDLPLGQCSDNLKGPCKGSPFDQMVSLYRDLFTSCTTTQMESSPFLRSFENTYGEYSISPLIGDEKTCNLITIDH